MIPNWAKSSVDENSVSLTVTSIGKAGASLIVFLGMIGWVDPSITNEAWGGFVASVITAVPAGFAVYHSAQGVWGIIRKVSVRATALMAKAPPPAV